MHLSLLRVKLVAEGSASPNIRTIHYKKVGVKLFAGLNWFGSWLCQSRKPYWVNKYLESTFQTNWRRSFFAGIAGKADSYKGNCHKIGIKIQNRSLQAPYILINIVPDMPSSCFHHWLYFRKKSIVAKSFEWSWQNWHMHSISHVAEEYIIRRTQLTMAWPCI